MNDEMINRMYREAWYMIETKKTIREIALLEYVSKSTVHKDLSERLKKINTCLYNEIRLILDEHIEERHIRGGNSTKERYLQLKKG